MKQHFTFNGGWILVEASLKFGCNQTATKSQLSVSVSILYYKRRQNPYVPFAGLKSDLWADVGKGMVKRDKL